MECWKLMEMECLTTSKGLFCYSQLWMRKSSEPLLRHVSWYGKNLLRTIHIHTEIVKQNSKAQTRRQWSYVRPPSSQLLRFLKFKCSRCIALPARWNAGLLLMQRTSRPLPAANRKKTYELKEIKSSEYIIHSGMILSYCLILWTSYCRCVTFVMFWI